MFISKRKYEEAIKEAEERMCRSYEEKMVDRNREEFYQGRFRDIDFRMNKAFADIDRRLNALEKQKAIDINDVCCSPKY